MNVKYFLMTVFYCGTYSFLHTMDNNNEPALIIFVGCKSSTAIETNNKKYYELVASKNILKAYLNKEIAERKKRISELAGEIKNGIKELCVETLVQKFFCVGTLARLAFFTVSNYRN